MYKQLILSTATILFTQYAFAMKPIHIPPGDYLIADKRTGCKRVNNFPKPNETIKYSGKCVNGYANGFGKTKWFKNGKPNGNSDDYFDMGFVIGGKGSNVSNFVEAKDNSNGCSLYLPIRSGSIKFRKLFSAKFTDGCQNGAGNYAVNIYFSNEFFGKYQGAIRRKRLPHGGKLKLFTGSVYQLGKDNGDYIPYTKFWEDWSGGLKRLEIADTGSSSYTENDFHIKLGLNSKPTSSRVDTANLWLFNLEADSANNDVYLHYDIKPKRRLKSKNLRINFQVSIDYKEKSSMGIFGISKNKQFNKIVSVDLLRNKGYKARGKVRIGNFDTFAAGLGVEMRLSNFKSSVKVMSIDEQ